MRYYYSSLTILFFCIVLGSAPPLWAQADLENPRPGSFQSGIGLVRGWVCQATRVEIEVVGRGTLPAVYGEPRGDTQSACGGKADNGFSLQVNWNELGSGTYTLRALADGVEFARATFTVATLGENFLRGASRTVIVTDFPQPGTSTILQWQESNQNFVVKELSSSGPFAGQWSINSSYQSNSCNFINLDATSTLKVTAPLTENGSSLAANAIINLPPLGGLSLAPVNLQFTGTVQQNGDFTLSATQPIANTVDPCTLGLVPEIVGNFLSGSAKITGIVDRLGGNCSQLNLPCTIVYSGTITKSR